MSTSSGHCQFFRCAFLGMDVPAFVLASSRTREIRTFWYTELVPEVFLTFLQVCLASSYYLAVYFGFSAMLSVFCVLIL